MKVNTLVDCIGLGYDLKIDDVVELPDELAEKLIKFNYVEEVKTTRKAKEKVME